MAKLSIANKIVDNIDAIILDKDGTIIDFDKMWQKIIARRAEVIAEEVAKDHSMSETEIRQLKTKLVYNMGIDPLSGKVEPRGPVAIATRAEVMACAGSCLYNSGINWDVARKTVDFAFSHVDKTIDLKSLVYPVPELKETFAKWQKAGIKIFLASTDNVEKIAIAVDTLNLSEYLSGSIGGNEVTKSKPEPEMILTLAAKAGIDVSRTVMVGDAVTDVMMGNNAKCAASVGVLTGVTSEAALAEHTEYVVPSIADIHVV